MERLEQQLEEDIEKVMSDIKESYRDRSLGGATIPTRTASEAKQETMLDVIHADLGAIAGRLENIAKRNNSIVAEIIGEYPPGTSGKDAVDQPDPYSKLDKIKVRIEKIHSIINFIENTTERLERL